MPNDVIRLDDGWTFDSGQKMDEPPVVTPPVPPPVQRKKGKIMGTDFIPGKRDQRYRFYKNISTNVVAEAVKFGAPAADATAVKAAVDGVTTRMDATDTAQAGWAASGSEQILQLSGTGSSFDPATYQTTLKTSPVPGGVRVDFTKKGATAVNIYMRVRGAASWNKIGMDTETPYTDTTPAAQAGKPEVREYMGRGLLHDEEIGLDSDVVTGTFTG